MEKKITILCNTSSYTYTDFPASISLVKNTFKRKLTEEEVSDRISKLAEFEPKIKSGYLKRYSERVTSASTGAVFKE